MMTSIEKFLKETEWAELAWDDEQHKFEASGRHPLWDDNDLMHKSKSHMIGLGDTVKSAIEMFYSKCNEVTNNQGAL